MRCIIVRSRIRSGVHARSRSLRFAEGLDEVHRNAIAKMELGRYLERE